MNEKDLDNFNWRKVPLIDIEYDGPFWRGNLTGNNSSKINWHLPYFLD